MAKPNATTARRIEEEIKQKHFSHEYEKALINLIFTANWFESRQQTFFKQFDGLTLQQYNILRILRGQQGNPISLLEVKSRMLDRNSDTSRIIERMVQKGLIERKTCPNDRRQVDLTITKAGLELLATISDSHLQSTISSLMQLPTAKLKELNKLLDEARGCQPS